MDRFRNVSGQRDADGNMRLLLILDNNLSDSFFTSILLQRLEYNIYVVKTAEDALEVMTFSLPALILTEMALPRMSGIDFLKHIKQVPRTRAIPVIIHTNETNPEYEEICRREGCAKYLIKAADPNKLYAAIQSVTEPSPRRVIRFRTRLGVIVEDETTTKELGCEECITYLSEGGLYINTNDPQPPGTVLPVVFSLKDIKIRVEAIVLYSFTQKSRPFGEHGMGLKFLQISSEDKNLIRTFIQEQLTQNIAPKGKGSPPL
jgi:two-component system chemotaxis response regulator CheY